MSKKKKIVLIVSVLVLVVMAFLYYMILGARPKVKVEAAGATAMNISCNSYKDVEFYRIYRSAEKDGNYERIGAVEQNGFTDSDVEPQSTYWYKVAVVKSGKEGKLSFATKGITKSLPPTPVNVSADSITSESVTIRWNRVENVTNYYIYRRDDENNSYSIAVQSTWNSFVDSALAPGKKYTYKISSNNENGESEASSEIKVETAEKVNQRGNSN